MFLAYLRGVLRGFSIVAILLGSSAGGAPTFLICAGIVFLWATRRDPRATARSSPDPRSI